MNQTVVINKEKEKEQEKKKNGKRHKNHYKNRSNLKANAQHGGWRNSGQSGGGQVSRGRKRKLHVATFDEEARREYLTGFAKRKKERREEALEHLLTKARQERVQDRKEVREQLRRAHAEQFPDAKTTLDEDEDEMDKANIAAIGREFGGKGGIGGKGKSVQGVKQHVEQMDDDKFSKTIFGDDSVVTVTTTIDGLDGEQQDGAEDDEAGTAIDAHDSTIPGTSNDASSQYVAGKKNMRLGTSQTTKVLQRLLDKKKARKGGGSNKNNKNNATPKSSVKAKSKTKSKSKGKGRGKGTGKSKGSGSGGPNRKRR